MLVALMTIAIAVTGLAGCSGTGSGSDPAADAANGPETAQDENSPATAASAGSTMSDSTLAAYVCAKNIAVTPGTLAYLPVGAAGTPQTRGYVEYVPTNYAKKKFMAVHHQPSWRWRIRQRDDGRKTQGFQLFVPDGNDLSR